LKNKKQTFAEIKDINHRGKP